MISDEEYRYRDECFYCGQEIKDGEEVIFSWDWDAWCHTKCCPAFNPRNKPTRECKVCSIWRFRGKLKNTNP